MHPTRPLSVLHPWLVGLGALLGSGVLATGLGYVVELVAAWAGIAT